MESVRSKIASTIIMPRDLRDLIKANEEEVVTLIYKILDQYYKGVTDEFMVDIQIKRACRKVDFFSSELLAYSTPEFSLRAWLWIGDTITEWIDILLEAEDYESATNLRKMLNCEYE